MSEKPEIAHKMKFSIPKLLINIGILKNSAELFQVELANKKVCLYNCKLQFIGESAAVGRALTKTFIHSPFKTQGYKRMCKTKQIEEKGK